MVHCAPTDWIGLERRLEHVEWLATGKAVGSDYTVVGQNSDAVHAGDRHVVDERAFRNELRYGRRAAAAIATRGSSANVVDPENALNHVGDDQRTVVDTREARGTSTRWMRTPIVCQRH